ncbi:MAG: MFS transporter, partial [Sandarakinorhabdus sp.]|nr:MFS transporter [Sandarakinorhabdus sp.]
FTPGRLIQVIQGSALVTVVLNFVALWKQEPRVPRHLRAVQPPEPPAFRDSWNSYAAQKDAVPRLVAVGLGTLAFSMADILLEPYGGQVLGLGVGATTKLTATFAGGSLIGFTLASRILSRGGDPFRMAVYGAMVGIPALMMVIASASMQSTGVFAFGVMLMGFGSGLFGHGTLTATMNYAPRDQIGMAMGAWGTVQATAAGLGAASAGIIRDVVGAKALPMPWPVAANGYIAVYMLEIGLLLATLLAAMPLMRKRKTE